jgi:hypothetical protein
MIDDRLRSPLARAVVPVLGGVAFLAVLGLVLWGIAVLVSHHADPSDVHLGSNEFVLERLDKKVKVIAAEGPLLFPGLVGPAERQPIGVWHEGDATTSGWQVFSLVPEGGAPSCVLELDRADRTALVDPCTQKRYPSDGSTLPRVNSHVDLDGNLVIDLTPTPPPATTAG